MLSLTRRKGERITIGSDIEVTVLSVAGNRVRLGIRAPRQMPIYRAELVERIEQENRRALSSQLEGEVVSEQALVFPDGLFGMHEHKRFFLCEVSERTNCRALVSERDPTVSLLVVDAIEVWPDYPVEAARKAAGCGAGELAVAAVVTAPADGSPVSVNLAAPIVVRLDTREGRQVILEEEGLGIRHLMVSEQPADQGLEHRSA